MNGGMDPDGSPHSIIQKELFFFHSFFDLFIIIKKMALWNFILLAGGRLISMNIHHIPHRCRKFIVIKNALDILYPDRYLACINAVHRPTEKSRKLAYLSVRSILARSHPLCKRSFARLAESEGNISYGALKMK